MIPHIGAESVHTPSKLAKPTNMPQRHEHKSTIRVGRKVESFWNRDDKCIDVFGTETGLTTISLVRSSMYTSMDGTWMGSDASEPRHVKCVQGELHVSVSWNICLYCIPGKGVKGFLFGEVEGFAYCGFFIAVGLI